MIGRGHAAGVLARRGIRRAAGRAGPRRSPAGPEASGRTLLRKARPPDWTGPVVSPGSLTPQAGYGGDPARGRPRKHGNATSEPESSYSALTQSLPTPLPVGCGQPGIGASSTAAPEAVRRGPGVRSAGGLLGSHYRVEGNAEVAVADTTPLTNGTDVTCTDGVGGKVDCVLADTHG
jgi:hypothetical protein